MMRVIAPGGFKGQATVVHATPSEGVTSDVDNTAHLCYLNRCAIRYAAPLLTLDQDLRQAAVAMDASTLADEIVSLVREARRNPGGGVVLPGVP